MTPVLQTWPARKRPTRFVFISDLHCFSNRSIADEHTSTIDEAIRRSDVCVWGGDLFDFRWSQIGCEDTSIQHAIQWLQSRYDEHPEQQFVFLRGNHDAHHAFAERLGLWATHRERFQCGLDGLIAGDVFFVHGDVVEKGGSEAGFRSYRESWQAKPVAHPRAGRVYDVAVAARLHQAAAIAVHGHRRTCGRLAKWIQHQRDERLRSVRRVVFGHTHRYIGHRHVAGLDFYNGGAAIKHVKFKPVELVVS